MKINLNKKASLSKVQESTLVLGVFQAGEKAVMGPSLKPYASVLDSLVKDGVFFGKRDSTYFYRQTKGPHLLFFGLGKPDQVLGETYRRGGAYVYKNLAKEQQKTVALAVDSFFQKKSKNNKQDSLAFLEGLLLASYSFDLYKGKKPKKQKSMDVNCYTGKNSFDKETLSFATAKYECIAIARDLSNEPGNKLVPMELAKRVKKYAKEYGVTCKVLDTVALKKENMGGILGVGQGSVNPPCLISLEYKPTRPKKNMKKIAFVGKAITFDTGGISLKPGGAMDEMKHDMSGGANMLAATLLAAKLKCPNQINTYIASAENMPAGNAIVPSTILHTRSGKTIEVLNTDAEGRLVLADAIDYAQDKKPDALLDMATLTGAVLVALGEVASAIMGNNEDLMKKYKESAKNTGEKHWELPLYQEYADDMKGKVGDLRNIGTGRGAGSSKAGAFLQAFVKDKTKWIHIDCAGTAWNQPHLPYCSHGATGHGVRTLIDFAAHY